MKESIKKFISKWGIKGIIMGTRLTDPHSQNFKTLEKNDVD